MSRPHPLKVNSSRSMDNLLVDKDEPSQKVNKNTDSFTVSTDDGKPQVTYRSKFRKNDARPSRRSWHAAENRVLRTTQHVLKTTYDESNVHNRILYQTVNVDELNGQGNLWKIETLRNELKAVKYKLEDVAVRNLEQEQQSQGKLENMNLKSRIERMEASSTEFAKEKEQQRQEFTKRLQDLENIVGFTTTRNESQHAEYRSQVEAHEIITDTVFTECRKLNHVQQNQDETINNIDGRVTELENVRGTNTASAAVAMATAAVSSHKSDNLMNVCGALGGHQMAQQAQCEQLQTRIVGLENMSRTHTAVSVTALITADATSRKCDNMMEICGGLETNQNVLHNQDSRIHSRINDVAGDVLHLEDNLLPGNQDHVHDDENSDENADHDEHL